MTSDGRRTAREIFEEVVERPAHERSALLEAACGDDPELRARVERLLAADDRAAGFLEAGGWSAGADDTCPAMPRRIGRYRIRRLIAVGGMGTVYEAVQEHPRRTVAVKVMKIGLHSRSALRRFEYESELLARLRHPGIAQVFEAGTHGEGTTALPFFAMEYIPTARPITDYAVDNKLTVRQRLDLFIQVCDAVHHGHQKGIIHRDLKPSNILVDADGRVKIIDFGVARSTDSDMAVTSLRTNVGELIGTLQYMSPEQCEADPHNLDTRSDVYALGVVLYELLSGKPPYKVSGLSLTQALSVVRERSPAQLSTIDARLRGDVETVVQKALEKERGRRYGSAAELAEELRRCLRGEPVLARPVGRLERLIRWSKRNPSIAGLTAAIVVTLIASSIVSWYFAAEARLHARQVLNENLVARRNLYAARMNLAHRDWQAGRVEHVLQHLRSQLPEETGGHDLRGFEWHYLYRLCHGELLTLDDNWGAVSDVVFSPHGRFIASAHQGWGRQARVAVWNSVTGERIRVLTGHDFSSEAVAFSPDGTRIASGGGAKGGAGELIVWQADTGEEVFRLDGHTNLVRDVAFSPDGKYIASASADHTARIWDAQTGRELAILAGHAHWVHGVAFSPDSRRLATASADNTVRIWSVETGTELSRLEGHREAVYCVAYRADGRQIASASEDRTARLWDAMTGRELLVVRGHNDSVSHVTYSPDGKRFATSSGLVARLWDVATGRELETIRGHSDSVKSVAFSPDGTRLATASRDYTLKLWGVCANSEAADLIGHSDWSSVRAVAFSPDGRQLATGGGESGKRGELIVWDAATGQLQRRLGGHHDAVRSVAFSPDGARLASAGGEGGQPGELKIWDAATGALLHDLVGVSTPVQCVVFSPDGSRLVSAGGVEGQPGEVIVWDAAAGKALFSLKGLSRAALSVAFHPDGTRLATGCEDGKLTIRDARTGRELLSLAAHDTRFTHVAYSADGHWLASSGGSHGKVKLWDAQTGELRFEIPGHADLATCVAFSHDGTRLATTDARSVKVWDLTGCRQLLRLDKDLPGVWCVAFSSDGTRLAAGGYRGVVRIWDARPPSREARTEREALGLLRFFHDRLLLTSDVERAIESVANVSDDVRHKALELIERFCDDPRRLNEASWEIVKSPGMSDEQYRQAVRWSQRAVELAPSDGILLNTLGVAQCRAGQYEQAKRTLTASSEINAAVLGGPHPVGLALLAIAQYKLGETRRAANTLQRLRERMRESPWETDPTSEDLLAEAETVIQ